MVLPSLQITESPSPNVDDLLFDVVTAIELSDRDRRVADRRYRLLKEHLEKADSPLAKFLTSGSHIYVQGSMAIGATVVSGTEEDRFDLDALVEINVPPEWNDDQALDLLYEALKSFPGADKVVRCTRCVQIQFAFMHMDVTILDPTNGQGLEHAGEIFHSPDTGESRRVPASPFNFSAWFRSTVQSPSAQLIERMNTRRKSNGIDRFMLTEVEQAMAAEQHDIPDMIPPRLDSEQVLALKLLKRFLNLRYEDRNVKRPPSIYLAKLAADVGGSLMGLTAQLSRLAGRIQSDMHMYCMTSTRPDERNPPYPMDKLNDRWPVNAKDMDLLRADAEYLVKALEQVRQADFKEIVRVFSDLFGERISERSVKTYTDRLSNKGTSQSGKYLRGSGIHVPAATIVSPAIAKDASTVTPHNFHCEEVSKKSGQS